jgi:YfiR/HmsC-like
MEVPIETRNPDERRLVLKLVLTLVLMLAVASLGAGAEGSPVGEYQLKAVFLFNFGKFVEWPPQAFADPHDPFTICVLGESPFGSALEEAVRGKTVASRPIAIRLLSNPQQAHTCQILFVSASERNRMHGLLEGLRNSCVLTVGDTEDFTANGGIVQFRMKDARVRIEIDAEAAERATLRISSRLLSLAEPARH